MEQLTAEEKITKAIINLQKEKPFWAYLMLHMRRKPMTKEMLAHMPTLCVDATGTLYYADEFVNSLTQEEIKGCVAHEVIHLAFAHIMRKGERNHDMWNIAIDIVSNDMIISDGMSLPKGVIIPNSSHEVRIGQHKVVDIDKKNAEIIYNEFPTMKVKLKMPKGFGGQGQGDGKDDKGNGNGKGDEIEVEVFDTHAFGEADEKTGKTKQMSQAQIDRVRKDWEKRLTEAVIFAKQRGTLPAGMERRLEELLNSKVSWKEKLYKYITNQIPHDYTWSRPSRRSRSTGIYMPSTLKENLNITVAVDVSGSIGDKEYQEFISEMVGISKSFTHITMNCLFWDTAVNNDYLVKNGNVKIITDMKVCGYGGTTFSCVTDYLKENRKTPNVLVVFTDGFIESKYKKPDCNTIWVISERGSVDIPEKNGEYTIKLEPRA